MSNLKGGLQAHLTGAIDEMAVVLKLTELGHNVFVPVGNTRGVCDLMSTYGTNAYRIQVKQATLSSANGKSFLKIRCKDKGYTIEEIDCIIVHYEGRFFWLPPKVWLGKKSVCFMKGGKLEQYEI